MALNSYSILLFIFFFSISQSRTLYIEDVTGAYMAFQTWHPCSNGSLEFDFKTKDKLGLLLYAQTSTRDFIELTIQDGKLVFKIFLESFTRFGVGPQWPIALNKNYNLFFFYFLDFLTLLKTIEW